MSFLNVATTLPPGLIKPPTDTPDVFLKRFLRMFFFTEHNFSGPPQYYIDPHVKAIVAGSYANDPVMADYRQYGFMGVVVKPFKMVELTEVLHQLLITPSR